MIEWQIDKWQLYTLFCNFCEDEFTEKETLNTRNNFSKSENNSRKALCTYVHVYKAKSSLRPHKATIAVCFNPWTTRYTNTHYPARNNSLELPFTHMIQSNDSRMLRRVYRKGNTKYQKNNSRKALCTYVHVYKA